MKISQKLKVPAVPTVPAASIDQVQKHPLRSAHKVHWIPDDHVSLAPNGPGTCLIISETILTQKSIELVTNSGLHITLYLFVINYIISNLFLSSVQTNFYLTCTIKYTTVAAIYHLWIIISLFQRMVQLSQRNVEMLTGRNWLL